MGFSIFHLAILIVLVAVYFVPIVQILNKAGYSGWWSLIVFVPVANIVMLWVFAFADWPSLRGAPRQQPT
jgi:hypothetical protein